MNPLVQKICTLCEDKKVENLAIYPMADSIFSDFTIVCTASNPIQIKAVASEMHKVSRDGTFDAPESIQSGAPDSGWVIVDIPGIVSLHIVLQPTRDYYDLDGIFARRAKAKNT